MNEIKDKRILIIYTGGTIGMINTDYGYAPNKELFHKYLNEMPELNSPGMPYWEIIDMDPLLDSSNVAVKEWNKIGQLISDNYEDFDGFVILHGTDTMAYTASVLSFALENNRKPVILTGSQIPLCEVRNDARNNLISSIIIAAQGIMNEVGVYFGGRLMRGNRTVKNSSSGMMAFESPNFPHIADAGVDIWYNEKYTHSAEDLNNFAPGKFHFRQLKDIRIGVIKIFPGMDFSIYEPLLTPDIKAIVLESFGAGNIPGKGDALDVLSDKIIENNTIVAVCSQCPQGTVLLGAYEASSVLVCIGAVSCYDLTTEATVAKLYYLFSCGYTPEEIKKKMAENLRGEITTH